METAKKWFSYWFPHWLRLWLILIKKCDDEWRMLLQSNASFYVRDYSISCWIMRMIKQLKEDSGYFSAIYVTKIKYREQENTNFNILVI